MIQELKAFLLRGNVIDLAVAVVIGAAFTAIVDSLVGDLINPLIGLIFGQPDLSAISLTIGEGDDATVFAFGAFLNAIINFVLVGTVLFFVVKAANTAMERRKRHVEVEEEDEPEITEDVALLREIRDALVGGSPGATPPPPPPPPPTA